MVIYLIRHGHRADMLADYDGGANPPLSEIGFRQTEHLADFVAERNPNHLYSSAHLRALQTAEPIHRRLGGVWNVWPAFGETNSRSWDELMNLEPERAAKTAAWRTGHAAPDLSAEDVAELEGNFYLLSGLAGQYPGVELTQPFEWPDQWWYALEGESRETGFARIDMAIRALVARHADDDKIALVAHGNCGDLMVSALLGLSPSVPRRFSFSTASVTRIHVQESGKVMLNYVNRTEHLPAELRV